VTPGVIEQEDAALFINRVRHIESNFLMGLVISRDGNGGQFARRVQSKGYPHTFDVTCAIHDALYPRKDEHQVAVEGINGQRR
jgi:hypothetical protein